jgi:hypothetical protein
MKVAVIPHGKIEHGIGEIYAPQRGISEFPIAAYAANHNRRMCELFTLSNRWKSKSSQIDWITSQRSAWFQELGFLKGTGKAIHEL